MRNIFIKGYNSDISKDINACFSEDYPAIDSDVANLWRPIYEQGRLYRESDPDKEADIDILYDEFINPSITVVKEIAKHQEIYKKIVSDAK